MITYFVVIAIVLFFSYMAQGGYSSLVAMGKEKALQKNRDIKLFLFIIIATLTITAGCRFYVGTDYYNYIKLYNEDYSQRRWLDLLNIDEPLFPLIGKLSHDLFDSYFPMFLTASIITVGFTLYSSFKETTDFIFVTLLYIFAGGWTGSFNGVRQYIAIAIVFMGRKYILERKFWHFLLICFIAFLAHKSALFCVFIYFLYSEKFTAKRLILITLIAVIISRSYETMFDFIGWINDEEFVADNYALRSVNVLRILVGCAPAILAIYYGFTKKYKKEQVFYAYMLVINATMQVATGDSAYLARLALYTGAFIPLGLSSVLKSGDLRFNKIFKIIIVMLYAAFWLYEVLITTNLREFTWIFKYL